MQKSVTRMLAYSSIAQAGYILIGMAVAPYSQDGLTGSLFHIMNHAVMKSTAFIAAPVRQLFLQVIVLKNIGALAGECRLPLYACRSPCWHWQVFLL